MITIQRVINVDGYGTTIYAYDEVLEVFILIYDGQCIVMSEGTYRGEFELRTMVLDYTYGFLEFIKDEDWFYNELVNVIHSELKRWFKPRPYSGVRW